MTKEALSTTTFFPTIWNVLHDGVIVGFDGGVPGTLIVDISIAYLRKRFPDPGETIRLVLVDCTRFAYREYETDEFSTELPEIAAIGPEVVSASMKDGVCEVDCAGGTLEVVAAGGSICLDGGREVTLEELTTVADSYWKEWKEHWERANGAKERHTKLDAVTHVEKADTARRLALSRQESAGI
jgi:hypothetical protein